MRTKFLLISLIGLLLFQSSTPSVIALGNEKSFLNDASQEIKTAPSRSELIVRFSTAIGKTIVFKPQEQEAEGKVNTTGNEIPHLVLKRNGVPTPGFERTLKVSVDNLVIPPTGMYVQLVIETQHGDPDLDRKKNFRIRVWKETKFIPHDALGQLEANVPFQVTFNPMLELHDETIKTPTDYYRCRIIVTDTQGNRLQTYVKHYAFLLENQWRVPLSHIREATPGAAPDELLVYYYDMIPFQSSLRDPETRIPRQEIDRYIQTELIPAMVEAVQVQSNIWEFPWYEEWHNFRLEEPSKTLSVALGEHKIWFHGQPAFLGHSMISIRVDGTAGEYDSLTDGIMSVFHHELFHNHQRNLSLHYGKYAAIAGKDEAWMMFTEGTAVLASAVGQPTVQFKATAQPRSYLKRANAFIGLDGAVGGGLNKSYKEIPYHTALYWRFLYENCGGITATGEHPAAGMKVIRHALEALYKGEIVQINASTYVAQAFPLILDNALQSTPSCRFHSYEESLIHFARAIYGLRLDDGKCDESINSSNCELADVRHLYNRPPADIYLMKANDPQEIRGSIPSSYGIDLKELELDPSLDGKTLKLVFTSNADSNLAFNLEVWKIKTPNESSGMEGMTTQRIEPISVAAQNGNLTMEIKNLKVDDFDNLGLIITRMDPHEDTEAKGMYSIQLMTE